MVLAAVLVLAVAVAGGSYAYLQYRFDQINKIHVADEVAVQSGQPFTVLVIGSDSRVGDTGAQAQAFGSASLVTGQRSDVVQLWRVSPSTKQIQIVSIPRDTVVTMLPPDSEQFGTYNRINSSYNSGANQLVKTITANFGIPINHVVQVDFSGFEDAVNALGGIYLNFNYPAKDSYSGLDITTPGCQLLGGFQALAVARARHYEYYANGYWQYDPTSDFGRIQRQDTFIRALMDSAKSKVNPLTVNAFIGSIHEGVSIDDGLQLQPAHRPGPDVPLVQPGGPAGPDAPDGAVERVRWAGRRAHGRPAGGAAAPGQRLRVELDRAHQPTSGRERGAATSAHGDADHDGAERRRRSRRAGTSVAPTTTTTTAPPYNPTVCTPA